MTNRMSRRGFFAVLFGAMAAGTIATCPALGAAIEQFGINESKEIGNPDKIANLFRMYRSLLEGDKHAESNAKNVIALVEYMNTNFDPASIDHLEVLNFSRSPETFGIVADTLNEENLAKLAEGLVPFAVIRELVIQHNIGANYFDDVETDDFCSYHSGKYGMLAITRTNDSFKKFENNYNIRHVTGGSFWIEVTTDTSSEHGVTGPLWRTFKQCQVWELKNPWELQKEKSREQLRKRSAETKPDSAD